GAESGRRTNRFEAASARRRGQVPILDSWSRGVWVAETGSGAWRRLITTSPSEMAFASTRAIVMRCRGCLRFRSCPRVGEDGQSICLDGSPNPIRDAAAAESAVARSKGDGHASRSDPGAVERVLRRGLCRPDPRLGLGSAPARATRLQGAPAALAYMAELRSQLPLHRNCLG